jgi:hypothetical protein
MALRMTHITAVRTGVFHILKIRLRKYVSLSRLA